ncbi:hypothetical protein BDQ12DRAFT_729876 [Crucibulum laeve]|uniref:Uncharacterized protein n=1 Tax=Crucibulum laeve TaxID=68775 RepID=A0A5C3LDE8_9AGAR|nr:hypothetical protein BDQ12DRAFT_729876 [Crucibulum laeve]
MFLNATVPLIPAKDITRNLRLTHIGCCIFYILDSILSNYICLIPSILARISLISQSHINLYSSKSSPAVEPHSGQIFPPNQSLYNLPLGNSLLAIEPLLQLSDSALQFQIILVPS